MYYSQDCNHGALCFGTGCTPWMENLCPSASQDPNRLAVSLPHKFPKLPIVPSPEKAKGSAGPGSARTRRRRPSRVGLAWELPLMLFPSAQALRLWTSWPKLALPRPLTEPQTQRKSEDFASAGPGARKRRSLASARATARFTSARRPNRVGFQTGGQRVRWAFGVSDSLGLLTAGDKYMTVQKWSQLTCFQALQRLASQNSRTASTFSHLMVFRTTSLRSSRMML